MRGYSLCISPGFQLKFHFTERGSLAHVHSFVVPACIRCYRTSGVAGPTHIWSNPHFGNPLPRSTLVTDVACSQSDYGPFLANVAFRDPRILAAASRLQISSARALDIVRIHLLAHSLPRVLFLLAPTWQRVATDISIFFCATYSVFAQNDECFKSNLCRSFHLKLFQEEIAGRNDHYFDCKAGDRHDNLYYSYKVAIDNDYSTHVTHL